MSKSFHEFLIESGVARVRRMMWGNVPIVNSIGIFTAMNPNSMPPLATGSKQQNAAENNRLNRQLWDDLRAGNYGPIKCKGKFGAWEKSVIVPNIKRDTIINFARKYDQTAVIWGRKATDPNGHPYFEFEYLMREADPTPYKTIQTRQVHVGNQDVQNRDDLFTVILGSLRGKFPQKGEGADKYEDGRKVTIPFFDDPYKDYEPAAQYGHIQPKPGTASATGAVPAIPPSADDLRKAESFFIPLFDEPDAEVFLPDGIREPSYYGEALVHDPIAMQFVEEIRRCEKELAKEGYIPKHYWMYRGILQDNLDKLARHLR